MITAELADGRRLEFPDGTDPAVIQNTVKRVIAETKPKEESSLAAEAAKGAGRGLLNTAGMVLDAPENLYNLAKANIGSQIAAVRTALGAEDPTRYSPEVTHTNTLSNLLKRAVGADRLASTQDPTGKFVGTAAELAAGSLGPGTLANPVRNIVAPAVLGASGEAVAGDAGKIVGSLSPLAVTAAAGGVRRLLRGSADEAQSRAATMQSGGVEATLSDIAPSRGAIQSAVGKAPVASVVNNASITRQTEQIKSQVDGLIGNLPGKSAVGDSIQEGLAAWKKGFYDNWRKLDDKVTTLMGGHAVPLTETQTALAKLTSKINNNTLNNIFTPQTLKKIRTAIQNNNTLPFDVVIQLRREIGKKASGGFASLKSDVDTGDLKALYAALSKDITDAAGAVPGAAEAIKRANAYYAAGSDRIDAFYNKIYKQVNPEKVVDNLLAGGRRGALEIRAVMKVLPKDVRDEVAQISLAGMAKQRASDTGFSVETFLTNWNRATPEAKRALFAGTSNPDMLGKLDKIAEAAKIMRESNRQLFNPSGTGAVVSQGGPLFALYYAPLETMSAIAGSTAASYLMTNPKFVTWLAQSTRLPRGAAQAQIIRLGNIANASGDREFKEAVAQYADALQ